MVAVKRINGSDGEAKQAAKREAKFLAEFAGAENVVRLFAAYRHQDSFTLHLELCETDLLGWMQSRRQAPGESVVREVAKQVAKAVDIVHAAGIVHRDIKPSNLLLKPDPGREFPFVVKLSDFGLAVREAEMDNLVCGTPQYMAPEVLMRRGPCTRSVDLYSLGTVLYHLRTKAPPVRGRSVCELQQKFSLPTPPTDRLYYPAGTSVAFRDLCNRLLSVEPLKRPTIAEVRTHPFLVEDAAATFVVVDLGLDSLREGGPDSLEQRAARRIASEALRVVTVLQQAVRRVTTAAGRRAVLGLCHAVLARAAAAVEAKVGREVCSATKALTAKLHSRRDHYVQFTGDADTLPAPHVQQAVLWRLQSMARSASERKQFKVADALTDLAADVERALPADTECSKALSGEAMSSVSPGPITATATAPIDIPTTRVRFCFSCGSRFTAKDRVCVCGEMRMFSF